MCKLINLWDNPNAIKHCVGVNQTFLTFNHAAVTPVDMTFPLIKEAVAFMSLCLCQYYPK